MKTNRIAAVMSTLTVACLSAPAWAQDAAKPVAEEPGFMQRAGGLVMGLVLAIVTIAISLALGMFAVRKAIEMFDKTTKGINEWDELKKGNVAVGLLLAAMIYAVGSVISGGVEGLTNSLMNPSLSLAFVIVVAVGFVNLLIALFIATAVISKAISILDFMTKDLDEMAEIGRGNVAVAILVTGVLLAVSKIVATGVTALSSVLTVEKVAKVFNITL
ncbi:MAG: hypothetical protein HMLKMBBP_01145 [Planctomycetes bacterium]|nr:hypothetical protein [Planctomycetota bacterium]